MRNDSNENVVNFPINKTRQAPRIGYSWDGLDKQAHREANAMRMLRSYTLRVPRGKGSGLRNGRGEGAKVVARPGKKGSK